MRHIFIVNPAAGHSDTTESLIAEIEAVIGERTYEIHRTEGPGHARELVASLASKYASEACRFYACGGDGTLCEVVNGAVGHANAEVACVPCGTGNDFIKIFDHREPFRDLAAQIGGEPRTIDVMEVNGRYSINICNSGIDARVAHWVQLNKRKLPFSGIFPYITALIISFFRKIDRRCVLEIDGERQEGEYVIIVAANGRCYGGGFHAVPEAEPDDGLIDLVYVPKVSRLRFLLCVGKFAAGKHSELPEYIRYTRCREVRIATPDEEPVSCDGEIKLEKDVRIRLIDRGLRFVEPVGAHVARG